MRVELGTARLTLFAGLAFAVLRARRTQTIAVASPTRNAPLPSEPECETTRRQSRDHANPGCRPGPCSASIAIATKEFTVRAICESPTELENAECSLTGVTLGIVWIDLDR